ncbi:MAG: hemin receptor, partial [Fusobacteriaceae bacterium]
MKKILLICALGILAQRNAYAQSVKLEDTVVSETNFETNILEVAKNVTIITKEEIAESGSKTLGEVLRRVP